MQPSSWLAFGVTSKHLETFYWASSGLTGIPGLICLFPVFLDLEISLNIDGLATLALSLSHSCVRLWFLKSTPSLQIWVNKHLLSSRKASVQSKQNESLFLLLFVHSSVAHISPYCSDNNNYTVKQLLYWALSMCQACTGVNALCLLSNFILSLQLNEGDLLPFYRRGDWGLEWQFAKEWSWHSQYWIQSSTLHHFVDPVVGICINFCW